MDTVLSYVTLFYPRLILVRPDLVCVRLEGVKAELYRRARVRDLELLKNGRVQDTQNTNLLVV